MKVIAKHAGGYDPRKGPRHPDNQDPTLEAHAMDIEVRPNGVLEYRWVCSAKCKPGKWTTSALTARRGGERHVAAMERGATKTNERPTTAGKERP